LVATLLNGGNVEVFVDGLWTGLSDDKRLAYGGYGVVASLYEKIAGEKLKIIPVKSIDDGIIFGNVFTVDKSDKNRWGIIVDEKIKQLKD
jgi:hypothetical protein